MDLKESDSLPKLRAQIIINFFIIILEFFSDWWKFDHDRLLYTNLRTKYISACVLTRNEITADHFRTRKDTSTEYEDHKINFDL